MRLNIQSIPERNIFAENINKYKKAENKFSSSDFNADKNIFENSFSENIFENSSFQPNDFSELFEEYSKDNNSNIDENYVKQLYSQLSETTNSEKRANILAELQKIDNNENKSKEESKKAYIQQLKAVESAQSNEISNIYERLSKAETEQEKEEINELLAGKQEAFDKENNEIGLKIIQLETNIPENILKTAQNLYNELETTTDSNKRNDILNKINSMIDKNNLSDEGKKYLYEKQIFSLNRAQNHEIDKLRSQLSETTDENEINAINREINAKYNQYNKENNEISLKIAQIDTKLPKEKLEEISEIYDELAETTDSTKRNIFSTIIDDIIEEYNVSEKGQEYLYKRTLFGINKAQDTELQALNERLANAKDKEEREKIGYSIKSAEAKFVKENNNIEMKLFQLNG